MNREREAGWICILYTAKNELPNNVEACRVLADHGYQIQLLPSIAAGDKELRTKLLEDVYSNKNPDVRIDRYWIGDIKTPDKTTNVKKSTINRSIYSAAQQKVSIAIINLSEREYSLQDIKKGLIGALQPGRNKSITQVWIITKEKKLFIADRRIIFDDTIYDALRRL